MHLLGDGDGATASRGAWSSDDAPAPARLPTYAQGSDRADGGNAGGGGAPLAGSETEEEEQYARDDRSTDRLIDPPRGGRVRVSSACGVAPPARALRTDMDRRSMSEVLPTAAAVGARDPLSSRLLTRPARCDSRPPLSTNSSRRATRTCCGCGCRGLINASPMSTGGR